MNNKINYKKKQKNTKIIFTKFQNIKKFQFKNN